MNRILALMVFLITATAYSKDIPTPFWYSITQKILLETQDYIIHEDYSNNNLKGKSLKRKKLLGVPLQCDQRRELVQLPFITLKSDPLWNKIE